MNNYVKGALTDSSVKNRGARKEKKKKKEGRRKKRKKEKKRRRYICIS